METSSGFPNNLPPGWRRELASEGKKDYFKSLSSFLRDEYRAETEIFPVREKVLRALQEIDYEKVRVVILGQDPYHGPNQAVGLCFAVPNALLPKPPSLVNIFKEIEADLGKKVDRTQSELKHWVDQGVLLLNTVLTVRRGQAFSHREKGWEEFTNKVIEKLNGYALLSPETSLVASISVRRQFRIIQSLVWSQVSLLDDKDQD